MLVPFNFNINLNIDGRAAFDKLATWFIGVTSPEAYLRGVEAEVKAQRMLSGLGQSPPEDNELDARRRVEDLERRLRQLDVVRIAAKNVRADSDPGKVDADWRATAFDFTGNVATEDMRAFWGKLVAEQINSGGRFSIQTLHVLVSMSRLDAVRFTELCGYALYLDPGYNPYLVYDPNTEGSEWGRGAFRQVTFQQYMTFLGLGLISTQPYELTWFQQPRGDEVHFAYGDRVIVVKAKEREDLSGAIKLGPVQFTRAGRELCSIVDAPVYDEFLDFCVKRWRDDGWDVRLR